MQIPRSITDNLRFLIVEVDSQLSNLLDHFANPAEAFGARVVDRAGYAANLKSRIHGSCLQRLSCSDDNGADTHALRSIELIATELERIAELARDCVRQHGLLKDAGCLQPKAYGTMLERVRGGIGLIESAVQGNDAQTALKIAEIESKIDRGYHKLLKRYIADLKQKENTEDLTHALFIAHSVEQMGDALLDISESIISASLGQTVNLERYHSLQASMEHLHLRRKGKNVQIEPIAETRSGSAISGITTAGADADDYVAIFKDGQKRKVKEEREGVESWHEIYPGLAPKILSYKKRGRSAALLIEHLPGLTVEQILVNPSSTGLLDDTLKQLRQTLKSVWRETLTEKSVNAGFIGQLQKRLDDVYRIHPEFQSGNREICGLRVPSFEQLIQRATRYERRLAAPFSVYIHGDFNVDNIIYDPLEKRINFIDLHRSRYMDYVQDISVFMVSNYRLQIFDKPVRHRIHRLANDVYDIAARFARKHDDTTFELRLALGLARSFATSTRFILDKSLARSMFLRSRYLLEKVLTNDLDKPERFKTPVKEIFVG